MTSLIVFDSYTGNTKLIAYTLSDSLSEFGKVIIKKTDEESIIDTKAADILVIGSPTERRKPTFMIQQFLSDLKSKNITDLSFAAFDTRLNSAEWKTGSAANWITKRLKKMNYNLLLSPESFLINPEDRNLVEYESRRASNWGKTIGELYGRKV